MAKHVGHPVLEGMEKENHWFSGPSLLLTLPNKGSFLRLVFFKKRLQPRDTNTLTRSLFGKTKSQSNLERDWSTLAWRVLHCEILRFNDYLCVVCYFCS